MMEVPCLKCVWRKAQQTQSRSSACSVGQTHAATNEVSFVGLVATATIGLAAFRRRRPPSNPPVGRRRPPAAERQN
jgi:MYXO-CTERM domain-containing protein